MNNINQLANWVFRVVNHDFCPGLNGMTNWLKQPLGWVVTAIVFSLLVGAFIGPQGYILAVAFFVLLILGLAWPWLSMKGVHCQLVLPDRRVEENQELEVVFRVKNYWPLPVFGLIVKGDFLQESDKSEAIAFALKRVGAWSESEFRIPVTPRRRGKLPTGEVTVASGFPFGLMDISKTLNASQATLVWPTCSSLDGFPVSDSTRFSLYGALRDRAGHTGDSIGVRPYRVGDRLRNVHWAQSARSQKLMVRERQSIASTGATVFLDLSPDEHHGHGISSSFEWTIRIAASICNHLHETHSPVRVVCFGLKGQSQLSEDNRNGLRPIMDYLANLPTLGDALEMAEGLEASQVPEDRRIGSVYSWANSSEGHLFAIGSSQSKHIQSVSSREFATNVTPVVVDIDGFKSEEELSLLKRAEVSAIAGESNLPNHKPILIETPQAAAKNLVSGWNRSFSDAI